MKYEIDDIELIRHISALATVHGRISGAADAVETRSVDVYAVGDYLRQQIVPLWDEVQEVIGWMHNE